MIYEGVRELFLSSKLTIMIYIFLVILAVLLAAIGWQQTMINSVKECRERLSLQLTSTLIHLIAAALLVFCLLTSKQRGDEKINYPTVDGQQWCHQQ